MTKKRDKVQQVKKSTKDYKPRSEREIAMDFATKVHQKFDKMVKASILFGSQAKNTANASSDIDIIIIIDDASISWDLELVAWYREELGKLISAEDYSKDLHINTIKLTTWWQDLLHGDPVVLNVLRYGEALIDSGGFFNPIKSLLYAALQRAPAHLARSKSAEIGAIEGVYWCMVDSAQAALIMAGKLPPSPEHLPELLNTAFVEKGMLKVNAIRALKDIYALHKSISYGETNDVKGAEIDQWQETAEKFLLDMTQIINKLIEEQKNTKG